MNCKLVKKVNHVFNEKAQKEIRLTNYYLAFENGEFIPVECKFYSTKSTDKKDIENIERINSTNYVKFSTLATLLKDKDDK